MNLARPDRGTFPRLVLTGAVTALVDGTFASVLNVVVYDSTVTRLFQGVAATLLGREALDGGMRTAAVGLVLHVAVAFGWSAVFILGILRSPRIRRILARRRGGVLVAAVYGPCIWLFMSLVVIPLLVRRPPVLGLRWVVQLVGHFPCVGLPIVALGVPGRRAPGTPAS